MINLFSLKNKQKQKKKTKTKTFFGFRTYIFNKTILELYRFNIQESAAVK